MQLGQILVKNRSIYWFNTNKNHLGVLTQNYVKLFVKKSVSVSQWQLPNSNSRLWNTVSSLHQNKLLSNLSLRSLFVTPGSHQQAFDILVWFYEGHCWRSRLHQEVHHTSSKILQAFFQSYKTLLVFRVSESFNCKLSSPKQSIFIIHEIHNTSI